METKIIKDKRTGFKTVPASYVLFIEGSKILMLQRKNTGFWDGYYSLPAGHLEEGETAIESTVREAKEEVGVDIKKSDLEFAHVIHRFDLNSPCLGDENTLHERVDFFM